MKSNDKSDIEKLEECLETPSIKKLSEEYPADSRNIKIYKSMVGGIPIGSIFSCEHELFEESKRIEDTLKSFKIGVSVGDITKGPAITRYELHLGFGVTFNQIAALAKEISGAFLAERINILTPAPGRKIVGIEVPNQKRSKVLIRDIIDSHEWRRTKAKIPIALGIDNFDCKPIVADLAEMPHLLVSGITGSGISTCINSIVASIIFRFSPAELSFVMIDPNYRDLQNYRDLKHLTMPIAYDSQTACDAMKSLVEESRRRFELFKKVGVADISGFNSRTNTVKNRVESTGRTPGQLSYIIVIISEMSELMVMMPKDFKDSILRVFKLTGIHCIIATRRSDVVNNFIRYSIPTRICFKLEGENASKRILDVGGAEELLGEGDMLYKPSGTTVPRRVQGCFVSDGEIDCMFSVINSK